MEWIKPDTDTLGLERDSLGRRCDRAEAGAWVPVDLSEL